GDWRRVGGGFEMVAALAVNVPGFPIPRTAVAASAEKESALVAAGIVVERVSDMEQVAVNAALKAVDILAARAQVRVRAVEARTALRASEAKEALMGLGGRG